MQENTLDQHQVQQEDYGGGQDFAKFDIIDYVTISTTRRCN